MVRRPRSTRRSTISSLDAGRHSGRISLGGPEAAPGLARLLVAQRPLWLLDEPTVSLDAASVALLAKAINAHLTGGGIAIARPTFRSASPDAGDCDSSAASPRRRA